MPLLTRVYDPQDIPPDTRTTSPDQPITPQTLGIRAVLTTESPNSWTEVEGQGRIVRWGVEAREGNNPFTEWFSVENILFGTFGRGGGMPSILLDNAQAYKDAAVAHARLFILTEGVVVRLGAEITTTSVLGEIS